MRSDSYPTSTPMQTGTRRVTNPKWWTDEHTGAWDRIKTALKRDWEQTKANNSRGKHGVDMDQDAGDTLKQMAGKEPVPPVGAPAQDDWDSIEPGIRYGHGARTQYRDHADWDDRLEGKLREEWNDLKSGRTWDEAKAHVRRGWDSAKRSV